MGSGSVFILYTRKELDLKKGVGVIFDRVLNSVTKCFIAMVCLKKWDLIKTTKSVKITKMTKMVPLFWGLLGFRGGCEGRVW